MIQPQVHRPWFWEMSEYEAESNIQIPDLRSLDIIQESASLPLSSQNLWILF